MTSENKEGIQVLGNAKLVKADKIPEAITEMLTRHRNIVGDVEKALPAVKAKDIKEFLEKRLSNSKRTIQALEKGFVPVLVDSPVSLQSKDPSLKVELGEMMKTLPDEARLALERAKKLGIFDQFAISGGPRGGDPVVMGIIGSKFFLIAAWVNVDGGGALGYTFKHRSS